MCAGNSTLREQVDELLRLHDECGSFLEVPAAFQLRVASGPTDIPTEATCDVLRHEPAGGRGVGLEAIADTRAESRGEGTEDDPPLDFLEPSTEPGSLGRLGHYEIKEVIGRGGMGVVLRAFDSKLHRVVAIKVLATELAASATARRRFSREAQAAAAVCHEHVVTIHAVDEEHRPPYLVMQLVEGVSLQQKLDCDGPLELREILRIGMQTAEGLAAAHKQGLVHRDIKPANILLENGVERVKITDFGLARAADDASLTQSGVIAGTPLYMSPEQAEGSAVDQRSDLFSLGSVLYAACTGRPPFRGSSNVAVLKRVVEETPRPIREVNPDIPEWLCELIRRLQEKNPAHRPASAAEVATILARRLSEVQQPIQSVVDDAKGIETRLVPAGSPMGPGATPLPSSPRRQARFLAIAAVAVATVVVLGLCEATGVTHVRDSIAGLRTVRSRHLTGPVLLSPAEVSSSQLTSAAPRQPAATVSAPMVSGKKSRLEKVTSEVSGPAGVPTPAEWADSVSRLPVEKQVEAVSARLKELNPGFDGRLKATFQDGVVDTVSFGTDAVKDVSPVGALKKLWSVSATGSGKDRGALTDVSPLKSLSHLRSLVLSYNRVERLDPLKGLGPFYLDLGSNPVSDLKPLAGMPLEVLHLWSTDVSDITPLAHVPLKELNLGGAPVRDLSPLTQMPLEWLNISYTHVSDLTPLERLPLKTLHIDGMRFTSLDALKGARLRELHYTKSSVPDLSALKSIPLEEVTCDFQPQRDAAILRSIPTLKTINGKPVGEFWKEVEDQRGASKRAEYPKESRYY